MKLILSLFPLLSLRLAVFRLTVLVGCAATLNALSQEQAEVFINQPMVEYDGTPKFPLFSTNPAGLALDVAIFPRSQAEEVFRTIPRPAEPSYPSYGIHGTTNRALGDEINLGGTARSLESVDVAMVSFSKASSWPALALESEEGYRHPISILIYQVDGDSLTLLAQQTEEVLIPWVPEALDDGSEYPFGGIGVTARINFDQSPTLSGRIAILVAYNTETAGFDPTGTPGPYNQLNVALGGASPSVGSDVEPTRMLRFLTGISKSSAFGSLSPIFTVRAFPASPLIGAPLNAGHYRVVATVKEPGYTGSTAGNFEIRPVEAEILVTGLRQSGDGEPKAVTAVTDPPGLPVEVVYARRSGPPVEQGLYPFFVNLASGNYSARLSGTMRVGRSFADWASQRVAAGQLAAGASGKDDDPDFDGLPNFWEYALGSDPGRTSFGEPVLPRFTRVPSGLVFSFGRDNEATDVVIQLQKTTNLQDPGAWREVPLLREPTQPFVAKEQMTVPIAEDEILPAAFYRLRLSAAGE